MLVDTRILKLARIPNSKGFFLGSQNIIRKLIANQEFRRQEIICIIKMFTVVRLKKPNTFSPTTVATALNQRDHENQNLWRGLSLPEECPNWPSQVSLIFHTSVTK